MRRWWAVLLLCGAAIAAVHYNLAGSGSVREMNSVFGHFGLAFLLYLAALPAARRLGRSHSALVLGWCFVVAAASLSAYLPSDLVLSSEINRYRWDGIVAQAGHNPYTVAPDDPELKPLRDAFQGDIPHGSRKGIYSPLAELFFYAMAGYGADSLFHYRALFSVMALLCGLAFLPLCQAARVPATRVMVFLWHPLLIIETAANAHLETFSLLFVLLSLSLLINAHQLTPLGSLALGALIRPYPLALFPLYLRRIPIYRIVLFFLVLVVGTLPFIGAGRQLWEGIVGYFQHARFNPGLYVLFEEIFAWAGRPEWTRTTIGLLGLGIAMWLYVTDDGTDSSVLRRTLYLSLPPVLLGPVVNPWYLLWVLPFLALAGRSSPLRMAVLYLTGSVFLSYVNLDWGHIPRWITGLEYAPVALLAGLGIWKRGKMESPV